MRFMRRKVIRAQEFVLADSKGNERVSLGTDVAQDTTLQFKDISGNVRMCLGLTANGTARVTLKYAGGKGSIQLEANEERNGVGIHIKGPTGSQVVLGIAPSGEPAIALLDESGKIVFSSHADSSDSVERHVQFDWNSVLRE